MSTEPWEQTKNCYMDGAGSYHWRAAPPGPRLLVLDFNFQGHQLAYSNEPLGKSHTGMGSKCKSYDIKASRLQCRNQRSIAIAYVAHMVKTTNDLLGSLGTVVSVTQVVAGKDTEYCRTTWHPALFRSA